MKKILIFSSLCKDKSILELALPSWLHQKREGLKMDLLLYNDNSNKEAFEFTNAFVAQHAAVSLLPSIFSEKSNYKDHVWKSASFDRIIAIKNTAIDYALAHDYDALFLVDADLVLHPQTLYHLAALNKDFVFEIFWTVFTDQLFAKPNCWDVHSWDYYNADSILKLKEPGTYKVGAGGACTLLSKKAMQAGVHFSKIKNMPFGGEDRHICTRAEVLGIDIHIDTHFPAFHIFNSSLIPQAQEWIKRGHSRDYFEPWLDAAWRSHVIAYTKPAVIFVPQHKLEKLKMALYKAKRAYINYMRYH